MWLCFCWSFAFWFAWGTTEERYHILIRCCIIFCMAIRVSDFVSDLVWLFMYQCVSDFVWLFMYQILYHMLCHILYDCSCITCCMPVHVSDVVWLFMYKMLYAYSCIILCIPIHVSDFVWPFMYQILYGYSCIMFCIRFCVRFKTPARSETSAGYSWSLRNGFPR